MRVLVVGAGAIGGISAAGCCRPARRNLSGSPEARIGAGECRSCDQKPKQRRDVKILPQCRPISSRRNSTLCC